VLFLQAFVSLRETIGTGDEKMKGSYYQKSYIIVFEVPFDVFLWNGWGGAEWDEAVERESFVFQ
jgi:hypothetical protein